jgi:hypothetical protein
VVTSLVLNRDQPGDEEAGRGPSSSRA